MSEWISVKQGLPAEGECLVMECGERKIIWSDGEGWFDRGRSCGRAEDMGITHWMPLPAPPLSEDKPTENSNG